MSRKLDWFNGLVLSSGSSKTVSLTLIVSFKACIPAQLSWANIRLQGWLPPVIAAN